VGFDEGFLNNFCGNLTLIDLGKDATRTIPVRKTLSIPTIRVMSLKEKEFEERLLNSFRT
jgi:hypothetical protein